MFNYRTTELDEEIQAKIVMLWDEWCEEHLRVRGGDDTFAMLEFFKRKVNGDLTRCILDANDQHEANTDFAWQRIKYFLLHVAEYREGVA